MDPVALTARVRECLDNGTTGMVVQALDHPHVRDAIAELAARGVPTVTVLSDISASGHLAYVGLDNRAAGRTAGHLMARFCRAPGTLAIVWGGQLYRSHEERESGFRSVIRVERPDLGCLELITGNDDPAESRERVAAVIAGHRDLAGVYCVGGGITGVADAIEAAGKAASLIMIGHNFNPETRPYLLSGTIDALIHQDMTAIAEAAVAALTLGEEPAPSAIPVEIITRENFMGR
jgi:LacI family transcriptional regulator